jgi:hypothetical protein
MDKMNKNYATTTSLVAVHNGDPMMDDTYDSGMGLSNFPGGFVDRQKGDTIDPSDFEASYLKRIKYVPAIDVFIDNISWNATTRLLSFRVNATTVAAFNGSYRFNAIITEMQVHGTTSLYDQSNYYSDGSFGAMGGFETKPDPVPAADMYYDFVARGLLDGWNGTANSIPPINASGQTKSYTYTKTIPAAWNEKKLHLTGFVINTADGSIENASLTVEMQPIISSIDNDVKNELIIYPNPTTGLINIMNTAPVDISAYNITGNELLRTERNVSQIDLSDLPEGVYFLKINNQKESFTKKIVLLK